MLCGVGQGLLTPFYFFEAGVVAVSALGGCNLNVR